MAREKWKWGLDKVGQRGEENGGICNSGNNKNKVKKLIERIHD